MSTESPIYVIFLKNVYIDNFVKKLYYFNKKSLNFYLL